MSLFVLILLYIIVPGVVPACKTDNRPYYLTTQYHYVEEKFMNWTAKGKTLDQRVAYVEELVDAYKISNSTPEDKYNSLSFDQLPLDTYHVEEVFKFENRESKAVCKLTARFTCVITDSDTSCTVSYNDPTSQMEKVFWIVLFFLIVLILFLIFIASIIAKRKQQRKLEADMISYGIPFKGIHINELLPNPPPYSREDSFCTKIPLK